MKKLLASMMLALTLLVSVGCVDSTGYGDCVGLMNQDQKDPDLNYELSVRNVVVGVIFIEMLFPPIIVALDQYECPTSRKVTQE